MPVSASGSPLANNVARKTALAKVRTALLDGPGIKREGGPPPPTAPAQDRTSPQERTQEAIRQQAPAETATGSEIPEQPQPQDVNPKPGLFDDETRKRLMENAQPFLTDMKMKKMATLHRRIGRSRRFWGGGL